MKWNQEHWKYSQFRRWNSPIDSKCKIERISIISVHLISMLEKRFFLISNMPKRLLVCALSTENCALCTHLPALGHSLNGNSIFIRTIVFSELIKVYYCQYNASSSLIRSLAHSHTHCCVAINSLNDFNFMCVVCIPRMKSDGSSRMFQ